MGMVVLEGACLVCLGSDERRCVVIAASLKDEGRRTLDVDTNIVRASIICATPFTKMATLNVSTTP